MFCPSCGSEEKSVTQFCRACGSNLNVVRNLLEKPDNITQSAAAARDEIGRAFAQKIRQTNDAVEMKIVAEDVLPQIEKFLESPEEKRLRRIRTGSIISFVGLGAAIAFSLIGTFVDKELFIMAGMGLVCLCIGLSFVVNGLIFTLPKKILADKSDEGKTQRQLEFEQVKTNELILPASNQVFTSVVENTTQHLHEKQPVLRK